MKTDGLGKCATSVRQEGGWWHVRYHHTDVVSFNRHERTVILRTGGWKTVTTKRRMNQASRQYKLGFSVYQQNSIWYVTITGGTPQVFRDTQLILQLPSEG